MKFKKNKIPYMLYILCLLQILFILIIAANRVLSHVLSHNYALDMDDFALVAVLAVMVLIFYFLFRIVLKIRLDERKFKVQQDTISNMQELNTRIRSQRHDFLNHLQIVYSLIELEDYEEARNYLSSLYGEIDRVNVFLKTEDAALNSLLQAKYNDSARLEIPFEIKVTSRLKDISVQGLDICRIMGNLIDNAIYAASNFDSEKRVTVRISETITSYEFSVENTGKSIPPENLSKIFQRGFSTKEEKGEGLGLSIVRRLTDRYGGTIDVYSENGLTRFSVKFKKIVKN